MLSNADSPLDFDAELVRSWFRLGGRRFPKFVKTEEIIEKTIAGAARDQVDLKALYDRIQKFQSNFLVSDLEIRLLPGVIFTGADADRPPLADNPTVVKRMQDVILQDDSWPAAKSFFDLFFSLYPKNSGTFSVLLKCGRALFQRYSKRFPKITRKLDFFSWDSPKRLAEECLQGKNCSVSDFLSETMIAEGDPDSAFSQSLWEANIPSYASVMRSAALRQNSQILSVEKAIRFIAADACVTLESGERKFRYPKAKEETILCFVKSIAAPYDVGSRVFSAGSGFPLDAITELNSFLNAAFPPNGPWPSVSAEIRRLEKFWEDGRQLVKAFEFADWLVKYLGGERFQWTPRYHFWTAYWRAGRITETRIYVRHTQIPQIQYAYSQELPLRLRGLTGEQIAPKVCLAFLIDHDVVAVEGNGSFSLRVGPLRLAKCFFWNDDQPRGRSLMDWTSDTVKHGQTTWKRKANDMIERYTGIAPPEDSA